MRVYIAPCGIGLGHMARCEPIARLLQSRGVEIVFSTYLDGLDYAKRSGFRVVQTIPIAFKVKPDGTVDFKMTAARSGFSLGMRTFLRQLVREIRNIKRFRPDVILSDSRASSLLAGRLLGIPTVLVLNQFKIEIVRRPSDRNIGLLDRLFFVIANLGWLLVRTLLMWVWARSHYIAIPDFPEPYTVCRASLSVPRRYGRKVHLVGPILSVTPGELPEQAKLKQALGLDPERPLIYAAISGPRVERTYLANELIQILGSFPPRYQIILSRGDPEGPTQPITHGSLLVYGWIEDQYRYLKACDLVISRAGHGTIMKAISYGKPMVLIPIPDQTEQLANASHSVRLGLAKMINQNELSPQRLLSEVEEVLGKKDIQYQASTAEGQVQAANGAVALADAIMELARLRKQW